MHMHYFIHRITYTVNTLNTLTQCVPALAIIIKMYASDASDAHKGAHTSNGVAMTEAAGFFFSFQFKFQAKSFIAYTDRHIDSK